MLALSVFGGIALLFYLLRKYQEQRWGYCKDFSMMNGKVVIITGANSGIGKETARELAKRGAVVVLACRNKQAAQEAVRDIRTTTAKGDLIFIELDLGNLASVRRCANILTEKFSRIDVLINNAGVAYPEDASDIATSDGFEIHFGVNHLGHFLFTNLLLERIRETKDSRIVIVSSLLYKKGVIDFESLASSEKSKLSIQLRKGRNILYSDSKLCNILHGQELSRRLVGTGTGVYILCPGFVYTGLFRHSLSKFSCFKKCCFLPIALLFMRSPTQGAQTSIYCATSEELDDVPFGFFRNCKLDTITSPSAADETLATQLWDFSSSLIENTN